MRVPTLPAGPILAAFRQEGDRKASPSPLLRRYAGPPEILPLFPRDRSPNGARGGKGGAHDVAATILLFYYRYLIA